MSELGKKAAKHCATPVASHAGLFREGQGIIFAAPGFRLRRKTETCRRRRTEPRLPPARREEVPETDIARAVAALESEAVRRALSGVEVPVFHQGRECGSTVKHSDQLLMFLLKTLNPERFGAAREAPRPARRAFALDIDLSAAGDAGGGPDCGEDCGPGCGEDADPEADEARDADGGGQ